MSDQRLSTDEIVAGLICCRANARELLEDADLLFRAAKHARAYTLMHSSCEELAKFFILEMAGKWLAQGHDLDWKRFWNRLRNHESKLGQLQVRALFEDLPPRTVDLEVLEPIFALGLIPRNHSLYVEIYEGKFRKPSDIDWTVPLEQLNSLAQAFLSLADSRGADAETLRATLHRDPMPEEKARATWVFTQVAARLRDAGMSQEVMEKAINRAYRSSASAARDNKEK